MLTLPVVLELLVAVEEMVEAKIDRPHVERSHFRLKRRRRLHSLGDSHIGAATSRDVNGRLGLLLDARKETRERLRSLVGFARLRIARMQMQNCGRGLCRINRMLYNLIRRNWEMW